LGGGVLALDKKIAWIGGDDPAREAPRAAAKKRNTRHNPRDRR
jgi:hypothetical protein